MQKENMKKETNKLSSEKITYHVGWRKGTISLEHHLTPFPNTRLDNFLGHYIWRPTAFLPAKLQLYSLCFLLVGGLALMFMLIYELLQNV